MTQKNLRALPDSRFQTRHFAGLDDLWTVDPNHTEQFFREPLDRKSVV